MSLVSNLNHNHVLNRLQFLLETYLQDKNCELFRENIDLILADPEKITLSSLSELKKDGKVQPDLLVLCNQRYEVVGNNIVGIPDFIIEILSPGSVKLDKILKKEKYLALGVKEYWIVDCYEEEVIQYFNGEEQSFSMTAKVPVGVFSDLEIDFSTIDTRKFLL